MDTSDRPTFAIYTLGCKINQYDSNRIAAQMRERGFVQVAFCEAADAYIIDTCTVTGQADQKSRKAVRRAARNNPHAVIAVTGCAAVWAGDSFKRISPCAIVVGNDGKEGLPERIIEALERRASFDFVSKTDLPVDGPYVVPMGSRTRAILKIMEGCHRSCAFCIIPRVRGKPVSRPMDEVIAEARAMADLGAREVTLTGVIFGWYGTDVEPRGRSKLPELLRRLQEIDGLRRIRLSAIDPRDVSDRLVDAMADCGKLCRHLHLVLQSGCDATLRAMRRGYDTAYYADRARRLRAAIPEIALHTDVIVGFPGETDERFAETLSFVREIGFAGMHIFPFSRRPGTAAAEMPDAALPEVAAHRGRRLAEVEAEMRAAYANRYAGREVTILVERSSPGEGCSGLTDTYVRVRARGEGAFDPGDLVTIRADSWSGKHLTGEVAMAMTRTS